jgi:2-polyprenyl-3-methyl-5-hydroxy-6-metoxy-1,4-benzoquinol methylase
MDNDYTTFQARRLDCGDALGDVDVRPAIASYTAPSRDPSTERTQRIWSAGDYDRISVGFRDEAEAFVERMALSPEEDVLDSACGSGNLTIPAARTGANVTGFDLVPALLDTAASWAARERLAIRLDQGTVEDLPYENASFDTVLSMFGVMFAARPDRVVSELARVTRRGGRVALANWTRNGFIGQLLATHVAYVTPPAGSVSVLQWGDESVVRERLSERDWQVTTALRTLTFRYPYTPAGTAELFRTCYGPTIRTLEALDNQRAHSLAADLTYHWERHQRPGARGTQVESEYLEVIAIRR